MTDTTQGKVKTVHCAMCGKQITVFKVEGSPTWNGFCDHCRVAVHHKD